MKQFAHRNTYKETIFDLRPKRKKSMLKSGIPYRFRKKLLLDINPLKVIIHKGEGSEWSGGGFFNIYTFYPITPPPTSSKLF